MAQSNFPLPTGKSDKKTENFLPRYFRTDTNKKFLQSTTDVMTSEGVVEKIDAFVGRRNAATAQVKDSYLPDVSADRENYQFESSTVYKDELNNVNFFAGYTDFLGSVKNFKGSVSNHSLLNTQISYSWNPHIDWDKFSNFREYYWLPLGPTPINVTGQSIAVQSTYTVELEQGDQVPTYVFSPDGLTKNPTLKLFKGQTYTFDINTPGHPIAFVSDIRFNDNDPLLAVDAENNSTLYNTGITKYNRLEDGTLVETTDEWIENGRIVFVVDTDVPPTLNYVSQNEVNLSGVATFYNIEESSKIDVQQEILGKKTYTTESGLQLSNGMKLNFQGEVTPESYADGFWYVEGVGSKIVLIKEQDLEVPVIFTSEVSIPFDGTNYPFDQFPFEDARSYPATKDYICINRSSKDRNPWSRYNRWFHKDVIEASYTANNLDVSLNQDARAKRPIIEFEAGLKLYNHGNKSKQNVDLIDTFTTDVFSIIEGSGGYIIDGVEITQDMRILFTADPDITVNGKIYTVNFINFGTGATKTRQISLVETTDTTPNEGDCVLVLLGDVNSGEMYHYTSNAWKKSQAKTAVNEAPHFDLYDTNGNAFTDPTYYEGSTFTGTKLFSYKRGTGTNDVELGFPLTYESINNFGDIVFNFDYNIESFNYQDENSNTVSKALKTGMFKVYDSTGDNFTYQNVWKQTYFKSRQAVIRQYNAKVNDFDVDVFNNSYLLTDLQIKVFVNGQKKIEGIDYNLVNSIPHKRVQFVKNLSSTDIVVLKCYSASPKNINGYYEVPKNLESNPTNADVETFTIGEVNKHVNSILSDHPDATGFAPGNTNLRDIGNGTKYGSQFMKHSSPFNLASYHIVDKNSNVIKSINFAQSEYSRFKRAFLTESTKTGFHGSTADHVDLIMSKLTKDKTSSFAFFASDMVPFNTSRKTVSVVDYTGIEYIATSYDNFDLTTLSSKAVLVYVNDEIKTLNKDYTIEDGFVKYSNAVEGDEITVVEYDNTAGCFVPPTPTKLGFMPKYEPQIINDTSVSGNVPMIIGHDGSRVKAYNDYRDDLLLELEKRIYNNIKIEYDVNFLDINSVVEGKFRKTNYSTTNFNTILLEDFSKWLNSADNPDYTKQDFYDGANTLTYNYRNMVDYDGQKLVGFWRNIYRYYYDTDRPHITPWEMLGFTIKPTWWESVYGPAPYTYNNTPMWQDLRDGLVKEPGKPVVQLKNYVRKDLMKIIPVDEQGNLRGPSASGLATNFVLVDTIKSFVYGDGSPVENAWRNSSEYYFALLKAWVLLQPSHVFGLGFDRSRIKKDLAGNLVYTESDQQIACKDLVFPTISEGTDNEILTSGLVNYIANYVKYSVDSKYTNYQTILKGLSNQLAIRLGGFAEKNKLKLLLDSRSPLNKTNVFVPDENYQIFLNKSSVQDTAILSGVTIEKTTNNGYIVKGYDKQNPTFTIFNFIEQKSDKEINVGGISENFLPFAENSTYTVGTIVRYNGEFYRAKVTHVSTGKFEPDNFAKLAELPINGGKGAIIRKAFEDTPIQIPYGQRFNNDQELVDFLLGYEAYLKSIGFILDSINPEGGEVENMTLVVKEFLFFGTQNWKAGTVLAVSPIANSCKFSRKYFTVDNLFDNFYDYSIVSSNGNLISADQVNAFRDRDIDFAINTVGNDEGIYLVKLPLVQQEHIILLDNSTIFNDTLYDLAAGFRQDRIKLIGYRTDNWTGSLNIPGFFYDEARTVIWTQNTDYQVGDIVKYKEFYYSSFAKHTSKTKFDDTKWRRLDSRPVSQIYPNWDYKANQFADFYDLDTDNFDTEQQRLAQHLIGYQKRQYLENIITDSVSQYKFYQGYIQEKGTKNALDKLFDALSSSDKDSVEFYEEWALRLGQYGSVDNIQETEYVIDEAKYKLNPQIFELVNRVDNNRKDLVYEYTPREVYKSPNEYSHTLTGITTENRYITRNSGYVRDSDVEYIVRDKSFLPTIDLDTLPIGKHIWITNEKSDWTVLKHSKSTYNVKDLEVFVNNGIPTVKLIMDRQIETIAVNDYIGVYTDIPLLKGFYQVTNILANTIEFATETEIEYENDEDSFNATTGAVVSVFNKRRFANVDDLNTNIVDLETDNLDKLWLDDKGTGEWSVYENKSIFSLYKEFPNTSNNKCNIFVEGNITGSVNVGDVVKLNDSAGYSSVFAKYYDSVNNRTALTVNNTGVSVWPVGYNLFLDDSTDLGKMVDVQYEQIQAYDASESNLTTAKTEYLSNDSWNEGVLEIMRRTGDTLEYRQTENFLATDYHDSNSGYGYSLSVSPDSKYVIVGAPFASNVISKFKGTIDPAGVYTVGDIVVDRGQLWRAKVDISNWHDDNSDSSSINAGDNEDLWEPVYSLVTTGDGTASGLTNQGAVYVYELDSVSRNYSLQTVMFSPEPKANENFGWEVKLIKNIRGTYKLFVSAPAESVGAIYFFEFDADTTEWKWTRNRAYKGVFDVDEKYRTGNIVYYQNALYQALVDRLPSVTPATEKLPSDTNSWTPAADIEHTGFVPNREQDLDGDNDVNEQYFGRRFFVNTNGDKLVAQSTKAGQRTLTVYNQPVDRWTYIQELTGDTTNDWAVDFAINNEGDKIAISEPANDVTGTNKGTVHVYQQQTNSTYTLAQNLYSPLSERNEYFGSAVDFSGSKLAVCGKNSDKITVTKFDVTANGALTFDNGTTRFGTIEPDLGRIMIFEEIGDNFTYAESIDYQRKTFAYSLDDFKFINNHIYLNLPNYLPTASSAPTADSRYVTNNIPGLSAEFVFEKNKTSNQVLTSQTNKPDIKQIQRVFLYDKNTADIIQDLDVIDPRQGRIAGPAEQEISFKTWYDPAVYTTAENADVVVDPQANWTDKYVGKIWWNLSQASWYDPYQQGSSYRATVFNKILPDSQVVVCEWVSTDLLPSEWNEQSGTSAGFTKGITGTALYDDTVYSEKLVFDATKQVFVPRYYYWVQNKTTVPTNTNRVISAKAVADLITDPAKQGYRYVGLLENNKFVLYNCANLIEGKNTIIHFRTYKDVNVKTAIHSEYQLITEGLDIDVPNTEIERKWIDSLVGYDTVGNPVPDPNLQVTKKYGVLNIPRQSMFINRIEAVKQFVDRANSVLTKNLIVDNYDITKLQSKDPLPILASSRFDVSIDEVENLQFIGTAKVKTAVLTPVIEFGKITSVTINNPGNGYKTAPLIEIETTYGKGAILKANINSNGQITSVTVTNTGFDYDDTTILKPRAFSVLVTADSTIGGRWSIYVYNKSQAVWERTDNQSYDTTKYWNYVDYYADGYGPNTIVDNTIEYSYELYAVQNKIGDVVKISNIGTGGWLLLKKINNIDTEDYTVNYQTIGRQNGTIKLSSLIYDYTTKTTGYDASVYDITFYDREPVQELRNIIDAIAQDLFIGDLAVEYNKLFFAGIKYVFSEQPNVDWAFKTSFIRAKHNVGDLAQKVAYQNDNLENYQDYINEVKPYSTNVREYISAYEKIEPSQSIITDFDLPPSYIDGKITPSAATFNGTEVVNLWSKYFTYPYKNWTDNNTYEVIRIDVLDGGSGFTDTPYVTFENDSTIGDTGLTAKAYISKGSVSSIEIVNKGARVYKAPIVTVSGNQAADGKPVLASAILGNSNARSSHVIVKFDRVSGKKYFETIDKTESFTGSGNQTKFMLKWPMNIKTDTFTVKIDGAIQLQNTYSVGNALDTQKSYHRYFGYVEFNEDPKIGQNIEIIYKKDVNLLQAADRILQEYKPTSGMPGLDTSQLMDGVEYEGALYDGIGFGTEQGFGVGGFSDLPWDTFDNTFQDEVINLDGSTNILQLSTVLENGVSYNVYLNGVRQDDPQYDGSTITANKNATMATIVGDGVTDTIDISGAFITTDGDQIIVRKESSDGSYAPVAASYDTALSGGALDRSTATGIPGGEVIVDGDGFYTQTANKGPEELVPGHVTDTLDMSVYTRTPDGVGLIAVANYVTDGSTVVFDMPRTPFGKDNVIVNLDGKLVEKTNYTVDVESNTVSLDITQETFEANKSISIMTMGANGSKLIDTKTKVLNQFDVDLLNSSGLEIETAIKYATDITAVVIINGKIGVNGTDYTTSNINSRLGITVLPPLDSPDYNFEVGNVIQYAVYDSAIQTYSQIYQDESWNPSLVNYYKFTDTNVPFNNKPLGHNMLVMWRANKQILSPGYSIHYTTTSSRIYSIDGWQFEPLSNLTSVDFLVYVDDVRLDQRYWAWDNVNGRITLLSNTIAPAGSQLDIYVLKNAEYYFVDTKLTLNELDGSTALNLDLLVQEGDTLYITSAATSTTYETIVRSIEDNVVTVRSYQKGLRNEYVADENFYITASGADSTALVISNIEFVESDSLTIDPDFANLAAEDFVLSVMHFSNHDINNFTRYTYQVLKETVVNENSPEANRRNLLSNGIIELEKPVIAAQYVFVMKNGKVLIPVVDYEVMETLDAVRLKVIPSENDRIDVLHFQNNTAAPRFGYRIFRDMLGRTHYKRLNEDNSYKLYKPLGQFDTKITLDDATGIIQPNTQSNIPGVLWIEGERVEYFAVEGNVLSQLRRGTLGTGVKYNYPVNTKVYGQGIDETIDYSDTYEVYKQLADGSNTVVDIDFEFDNINEIEVFVGGRKLSKVDVEVYNSSIAQDSPEADETRTKEFDVITVGSDKVVQFTTTPAVDTEIRIVKKTGKTWYKDGTSLRDSPSAIAKFLRGATIELPK